MQTSTTELIIHPDFSDPPFIIDESQPISTVAPFIEANTVESSLKQIKDNHIIPVFIKDNETVISHFEFIEGIQEAVAQIFPSETILAPSIRLSHPIKGRIPEARNKPAAELMSHEKTLYYERMAFVIEIPSISDTINGSQLNLVVGGVKAYNLDNLYSKKGTDEHFKIFIGFQNRVCTNLCVWTDGYLADLKVNSLRLLMSSANGLFRSYNETQHLTQLKKLTQYNLTEEQFAKLIGRCRMYAHLPTGLKKEIQPLLFGDSHIGMLVKDYYKDRNFSRDNQGSINLWSLYNLFTGTNKSSYIDTFLDREVNAFQFASDLRKGLENPGSNWFLT